ncbi:MAG: ISAs1 family transposase [Bulleidia sp.]
MRRVLTLLDSDMLYENTIRGFYMFLESMRNHYAVQGDYRHMCIDGKEMRESGRASNTKNPQHNYAMLNIYDASSYTIIECEAIDKKENEIPVAQRLLEKMDLKNAVITADALHCQKKTAFIILEGKGIYVLIAKDNQKSLYEEIQSRFNRYPEKVRKHEDDDRTIEIMELPNNYALKDEWAGFKAFAKMTSKKCTRYFISNINDDLLICQAIRNRWAVETFHKLKDYDMDEDAVRSTDKQALRNIAMMNNLGEQLYTLFQTISGLPHREAKVYFQENTIDCGRLSVSVWYASTLQLSYHNVQEISYAPYHSDHDRMTYF